MVADGRFFPEPLGDYLTAANLSWEIDIWHRSAKLTTCRRDAVPGDAEGTKLHHHPDRC